LSHEDPYGKICSGAPVDGCVVSDVKVLKLKELPAHNEIIAEQKSAIERVAVRVILSKDPGRDG
jgi:hypothetical protein